MLTINFSPFPILESERLRFRKLTDNDAPEILELRGNPETMKFIPRPRSRKKHNKKAFSFMQNLV